MSVPRYAPSLESTRTRHPSGLPCSRAARPASSTSPALVLPVRQEDENYLGEDTFKVERIVRKRLNDGAFEYLIKWEGWSRCVRLESASLDSTRRALASAREPPQLSPRSL